jgi:hypothetical protein
MTAEDRRHPRGPRRRRSGASTPLPDLGLLRAVSEEIHVPYTSLRDRAAAGDFKVIKIGRLDYVDRADIAAWIARLKADA